MMAFPSNFKIVKVLEAQRVSITNGSGEQANVPKTTDQKQSPYWVLGDNANGVMYGCLQVAENINSDGFTGEYGEQVSPNILERLMT